MGCCERVTRWQRIAAALYLSQFNPGTPLSQWRAMARRPQPLLEQMSS
jgi:hypothetical protein